MSLFDALKGSAVDADQVVREHGPRVRALLRKTFGPRADVDDLFQVAMLEIVRSLKHFKGESALSTWIHRIVLNVSYMEMRRAYRRPELVDVDDVELASNIYGADEDAHRMVEQREAERLLYAAVSELPAPQRIAVVLHDLHGLTLKDAAERLDTPLSTLAARVQSGRAALADRLAETLEKKKQAETEKKKKRKQQSDPEAG